MSTSTIQVYQYNKPAKGIRVSLEFSSNGFSKAGYTDADGIAYIEHSTIGNATVYINGQSKGSLQTPGRTIFYI